MRLQWAEKKTIHWEPLAKGSLVVVKDLDLETNGNSGLPNSSFTEWPLKKKRQTGRICWWCLRCNKQNMAQQQSPEKVTLAKLVRDHFTQQLALREEIERLKKASLKGAAQVADEMVYSLNEGVAAVFANQV